MLLKYLAYTFVLALYAAFAWAGKVPAEGFIAVLTGIISALGASHAFSAASQAVTDAAKHADPVVPPQSITLPTTISQR